MSQLIPALYDLDGNAMASQNAVQSRKVLTNLITTLDLKGGEGPNLWFPKEAVIQPVFIVGIDPSVSIPVTVPASLPVRTSIVQTIVIPVATPVGTQFGGTVLTVPDGCNNIICGFNATAFTAAGAGKFGWQASDDGVLFQTDVADPITYNPTVNGTGGTNWGSTTQSTDTLAVKKSLPKFVRFVWESNSVLANYTLQVWITVS